MPELKYDRDNLISLFAERAVFERSAVTLYDALLGSIEDAEHPLLVSSMDALMRHRDEEEVHAAWVEELLAKLGGRPERELSDAVTREARALSDVIERARRSGALLPMFHAMLSSELMDLEGWQLLLDVARDLDDGPAVTELETIVEREDEHLALVRRVIYTLAKESVSFHGDVDASAGVTADGDGATTAARRGGREIIDAQLSGPARATTDHETIRRWCEERGGTPSHVKRTGGRGDVGILRIDFPGWSGARSLEPIDWDAWLRAFDENDLAFIYEERTAGGEPSRFNKLVARDTIRRRLAGEGDASAHKGRANVGGARRGGAQASRTPRGRAGRGGVANGQTGRHA